MSKIPQLLNGNRLIHDAVSEKQWVSRSPASYVELFSDFIQDVGETLVLPWVATEQGSTAATADFIDAPDGVFQLAHTTASETQSVLLSLGGTNAISPTKEVVFEARVKITLSTDSAFDADSIYSVYIGMVTAGTAVSASATLFDGTADNVGFFLGGISGTNSIYLESDDATTNNDDKDSGKDFTSGTYHIYKIDMTDTSNVLFYVDGELANNGNSFDMSAIAATDYLEPFILFSRTNAGGTNRAHTMDIDYVKVTWKRS
jgi:hypothetical protein